MNFEEAVATIESAVTKAVDLDEQARAAWIEVADMARGLRPDIAYESELQRLAWIVRINEYESAVAAADERRGIAST